MIIDKEFHSKRSNIIGGVWLQGEFGFTLNSSSAAYISGAVYCYAIGVDENVSPYTLYVNEETAEINPANKWKEGTYHWMAIYTV